MGDPRKLRLPHLQLAAQPKVDPAKIEPPKIEPPKIEQPKVESPKIEPPKIESHNIVLTCPSCHKDLVIDRVASGYVASGQTLNCPSCGGSIVVPQQEPQKLQKLQESQDIQEPRLVTLSEAPETKDLESKPAWEQELISIEAALRETDQQRQEAGNFYKNHVSEANRLKVRMNKLDAKLKELESRRAALLTEHPKQK